MDRSLVYQRAKGSLDTLPFGTRRDVYAVGYEWCCHSLHPKKVENSRIIVGGKDCLVREEHSRTQRYGATAQRFFSFFPSPPSPPFPPPPSNPIPPPSSTSAG